MHWGGMVQLCGLG